MKLQRYAVLFISIAFIFGIFYGFQYGGNMHYLLGGILFSFLVFLLALSRERQRLIPGFWFPFATFILLFFLGIFSSYWRLPQNNPNHYLNQNYQKTAVWKVHIQKKLTSTSFATNYLAKVVQFDHRAVEGKLLLRIVREDSIENPLGVGDFLLAKASLASIRKPLNPGQFNYRYYMAHQGVYGQLKLTPLQIAIVHPNSTSLRLKASVLRKNIKAALLESGFSPTQTSLIQALLLGHKKEIPQKIYQNFAAAGVVHILAVSGLHIGILLLIIFFLLQPLLKFKYGRLLRSLISIGLLWAYALLAGFTPSILRAVVMFSCISFGLAFQRKAKIINMLCLSALILLIYHPYFIFDLGFQLSYTAVVAIITLQPKFASVYRGKNYLLRKSWTVVSVTLAAQLGVLPLSLYYFHQLPGLFFLTNFLLIPVLGLILGGGFLVILLALAGILPHFLTVAYAEVIQGVLFVVQWVAKQDQFILRQVYFSKPMLLISYLTLLLLFGFLYRKKKAYLFLTLCGIISLEGTFLLENYRNTHKKTWIVFHQSRESLLGFRKSGKLLVCYNGSNGALKNNSTLKNYQTQEGIAKLRLKHGIGNAYALNKQLLLVIDSLGVYQIPHLNKRPLVLLRNSPQINLERLLDSLNPKKIIVDGSNYTSYVKRWKNTCQKRKTPFHYTGEKGAFLIDY